MLIFLLQYCSTIHTVKILDCYLESFFRREFNNMIFVRMFVCLVGYFLVPATLSLIYELARKRDLMQFVDFFEQRSPH